MSFGTKMEADLYQYRARNFGFVTECKSIEINGKEKFIVRVYWQTGGK
jgi:hypothetical protein